MQPAIFQKLADQWPESNEGVRKIYLGLVTEPENWALVSVQDAVLGLRAERDTEQQQWVDSHAALVSAGQVSQDDLSSKPAYYLLTPEEWVEQHPEDAGLLE